MRKFCYQWLLPVVVTGVAYRYRYRLLNKLLENGWIRKMSVNAAMNIPGMRNRFMNSAFRK